MRKLGFFLFFLPIWAVASVYVGFGKTDITPPVGTPSAGYQARQGDGMKGTNDPLLALALFIDNGEKKIVLCSVDNLGFTYEMVQKITALVHKEVPDCEVYVASTHTHSGGGAFLNIPVVGEALAGKYDPDIAKMYVEKTAEAIVLASRNTVKGKIGVGYGTAQNLSVYRSTWPEDVIPLSDVAVIKVTKEDDSPFAILFNFPVHPTVLPHQNRYFSADFVGYARDALKIPAIYFNGAQGDVNPIDAPCDQIGEALAAVVKGVWDKTETSDNLEIFTKKLPYSLKPQATPKGIALPLETYKSEMNLIVLNGKDAFVTIPGELSCVYDKKLKEAGKAMGYSHVSIFGLTNDAHGYIILPESWRNKTFESRLSFGGENYGDETEKRALSLLESQRPGIN